MPRSWPHFFRPVAAPGRRSLAYQFTVNAPLLCPLFSIFRKFLHFQPCFSQNFSSLDPNFSKFSFPRPQFFKEKPLPIPYILKPAWHTSTKKKKVERPPPRGGGKDAYNLLLRTSHSFKENQPMHRRRNFLKENFNKNSWKLQKWLLVYLYTLNRPLFCF